MNYSVIICTHNPRPDYLVRVLNALRSQTAPVSEWELLLIDNASIEPVDQTFDVAWHPAARVIRVEKLGKVAALLRGVAESQGQLLVIVDDDNVLDHEYLAIAGRIGREWPILGAWGGSIIAEFEEVPQPWAQPYLRYLAIREVTRDEWSNFNDPGHFGQLPWGAGMCVRQEAARLWAERTSGHDLLSTLNRKGKGLLTGEDTEMALAACDLGLGTGLFSSLRLTHLIRAERVSEVYLLNLMEGMVYSLNVGAAIRGQVPEVMSWPRFLWGHFTALRRGFREFRFYRASVRGMRAAARDMAVRDKEVSRKMSHRHQPLDGAHNELPLP